ncbi:MAG: exosortase/archaeosortase family protein [Myxococcota bacterium]
MSWAVLVPFAIAFAPVVLDMASIWLNDGDRAYGAVVPLFAVYLAWERRDAAREQIDDGSWLALPLLLAGLGLLIFGTLVASSTLRSLSLPVTFIGMTAFHLGWSTAKVLATPLAFLFLMVPVPHYLYIAVAFPLQQLAASLAAGALETLGVVVFLEGNVLHLPHAALGVNEACSGIRSLFSLVVLALAWGTVSFTAATPTLLLAASAVPISVLTNGGRVVASGLTGRWFGREVANGAAHDLAGWVVFLAALLGLAAVHALLRRFFSERKS